VAKHWLPPADQLGKNVEPSNTIRLQEEERMAATGGRFEESKRDQEIRKDQLAEKQERTRSENNNEYEPPLSPKGRLRLEKTRTRASPGILYRCAINMV
jgi:hypothetical protein